MLVRAWTVHELGRPMTLAERDESPGAGEVLVAVAGCGVCHTDLGFFYDGVPTRHALPLTLGQRSAARSWWLVRARRAGSGGGWSCRR